MGKSGVAHAPVTVAKFSQDGENKFVIQGGGMSPEEAWVPASDAIVDASSHAFIKLDKGSKMLKVLVGVSLVRCEAFEKLKKLRNDAASAEISKLRAEQRVGKERISKRALETWDLPNSITVTLETSTHQRFAVMKMTTDFREVVCVSLDDESIQNVALFLYDGKSSEQINKGKHDYVRLGADVTYSVKRQCMWGFHVDDDNMRHKRVKKCVIDPDDLLCEDKMHAIAEDFWKTCYDTEIENADNVGEGAHELNQSHHDEAQSSA